MCSRQAPGFGRQDAPLRPSVGSPDDTPNFLLRRDGGCTLPFPFAVRQAQSPHYSQHNVVDVPRISGI